MINKIFEKFAICKQRWLSQTRQVILITLVPENEALIAEVQIKNDDVGFVHIGQKVKIKLLAYPFQKYGMVEAVLTHIGADAQDSQANSREIAGNSKMPAQPSYKALLTLNTQALAANGLNLALVPGMQVVAEIKQGQRTVLDYLLSPIQQAMHDSVRER